MNFYRPLILVLFSLSIVFNGCKKGEDDPLLSLTTRKARMSGSWSMTRGNVGLTGYKANQAPFNSNFEFTGSDGILTQSGTLIAYTLKYSLSLTFDKEGKMSMTENFSGSTLMSTGTWNFCSGVGKTKNKADMFIKLDAVSAGDTQEHLFNNFGTEITYHIKRLTNDELVLYTNAEGYMNISGDKGVFQGQYTFKKHK